MIQAPAPGIRVAGAIPGAADMVTALAAGTVERCVDCTWSRYALAVTIDAAWCVQLPGCCPGIEGVSDAHMSACDASDLSPCGRAIPGGGDRRGFCCRLVAG